MSVEEKQFLEILTHMCKDVSHVKAIALLDVEKHRLLGGILPPSCEQEVVNSVISPAIQLITNAVGEFERRHVKQIAIKSKQGIMIIHVVTLQQVLLVFTSHKVQLDALIEKIKEIATQITDLLGTSPVIFCK